MLEGSTWRVRIPARAQAGIRAGPGTLFCIALICGALAGCHPRPLPSSAPVIPYAGSWEYRYGDSPLLASGPAWAQPSSAGSAPAEAGGGGWQPTTVLENPPGRADARLLWMRTRLSGPPLRDPVLFLVDIDQSYEAYLDGKLIERFGPLQGAHYPGLPKVYLPLGSDYAGKTLVLRIYSPYGFIGLFGTPLIGGSKEMILQVVENGLPPAFLGMLLIILGSGALILFALRPRERAYFHYGVLTIGMGTHVLCRSIMRELIADLGPVWSYLELASNAVAGAALCLFVAHMFGPGPLRIVRRVGQVLFASLLLSTVLIAVGAIHFWSVMRPQNFIRQSS